MVSQSRDPASGRILIEGGGGDETFYVDRSPNGGVIVTARDATGQEIFQQLFSPAEAELLDIRGGDGDDRVIVSPEVQQTIQAEFETQSDTDDPGFTVVRDGDEVQIIEEPDDSQRAGDEEWFTVVHDGDETTVYE